MRSALTAIGLCVLFIVLLVAGRPAAQHASQDLDCSGCHLCQKPTAGDPCLKTCPRHKVAADLRPDLGPHVVILDELEDLYVPVRFDHLAHATMAGMAEGCEACHHFTPPNSEHPECKSCHPREIIHEDIAQPGLKGAYHRQCMSCHTEWDRDTQCEVCHEKKAGGRLHGTATEAREHAHYEPVEMIELIIFPTEYAEGDEVPFHHRNHSRLYERDCTECHHQQGCSRCHVHDGTELHPMGVPAETDLHETCFSCHPQDRCEECHGRDPDDLFQHSDTGWPLKVYHRRLHCRSCHGQRGQFMKLSPGCENCHPGGWKPESFAHEVTGVALGEMHGGLDCGDCHHDGPGRGSSCADCHDDGRVYDRATGFGES